MKMGKWAVAIFGVMLNAVIVTSIMADEANVKKLEHNFANQSVGQINYTFSIRSATIDTGRCTQRGVWRWYGNVASYAGYVLPDSDAMQDEHMGKFKGTYHYNPSGEEGPSAAKSTVKEWEGFLTGTAGNDCAHGIASCSVVPTFLFAGKYADLTFETCGHNGTGWESTIGIEIEETTSSDQPYPQPLELNSDANSNRWTTRIVVLRADRRDLYAKNVNIHITVKCDIENRPCDRAFRYAIIDNKAQPR